MIRYAITQGTGNSEQEAGPVDFVQLRAKDVEAGELAARARALLRALQGTGARLLVNGRVDVAVAVGATGVHLTSGADELSASQVGEVFAAAGMGVPVISRSCHSIAEVELARDEEIDLILFGPVFEKRVEGELVGAGVGLEMLRLACVAAGNVPVLALGGVTEANAVECLEAGVAGVAGIRMFG